MGASSDSTDVDQGSQKNLPPHHGRVEVDEFTAYSSEVEEIVDHIREIPDSDEVEILYDDGENWVARYTPTMEGAEESSARNNDFNVLHQYPELVEEFLEELGEGINPERNVDAVISQGRNISDILAAMYDRPVKRNEGSWVSPVLAVDEGTGAHDEVLISNARKGNVDYIATKLPSGEYGKAEQAAAFNVEFLEEEELGGSLDEDEIEAHNALATASADINVGKSKETPDEIRNTELLQHTTTELKELLEPGKIERIHFRRDQDLGSDYTQGFEATIHYEDGTKKGAELTEKAFPATKTFKQMPPVQEYRSEDKETESLPKTNPFVIGTRAAGLWTKLGAKMVEQGMDRMEQHPLFLTGGRRSGSTAE